MSGWVRWLGLWALCACMCAGTALAEGPRLVLWVAADKGYDGFQRVGDRFTALSGVQVRVERPEGAAEKFQQAVTAGRGPDIICLAHNNAGAWARAGLLAPLAINRATVQQLEPVALQAFTFDGRLWGYPLAIEAVGLIYNKALVREPPTTFDGVVALDRQLQQQHGGRVRALLWDYNSSYYTWPLLAGAGGTVFEGPGSAPATTRRPGVNHPGAVQAGEVIARLVRDGHMPNGVRYSEVEAQFARGQVAMVISGPWSWDNARRAGIDFGVAALPAVIPGKPSKPFVGVLGCMVSAVSPSKDIAREFLEFHLLKPDSLKTINADVPLGVPAHRGFAAELARDPAIATTLANARQGRVMPQAADLGRFFLAMNAALEAISSGRQAPRAALDQAAERMRGQ
jgi:maltose/maltodextrin transport system substrate-binding protein